MYQIERATFSGLAQCCVSLRCRFANIWHLPTAGWVLQPEPIVTPLLGFHHHHNKCLPMVPLHCGGIQTRAWAKHTQELCVPVANDDGNLIDYGIGYHSRRSHRVPTGPLLPCTQFVHRHVCLACAPELHI